VRAVSAQPCPYSHFFTYNSRLAAFNGVEIKFAQYILLAIIASIGSMGSAPVPSGSLVLIITAYNTVFNTTGVPNGFEFIIPIDWFLGRMQTILNITGDAVVAGMVAHLCPDVAEVEHELAEIEQLNETGKQTSAKGVEDEDEA
jgi:Na+/H+-dicarboxylate symporter